MRLRELIAGFEADHVIADKDCDAGSFIEAMCQQGGEPVIPPRSCWKTPRDHDKPLYEERNKIERFSNDKLLANFMGFIKRAAIARWLK